MVKNLIKNLPKEITFQVSFYNERIYYWKTLDTIPLELYRFLKRKDVISEFNRLKICGVCPWCKHVKQDTLIRMFHPDKVKQLLFKLGYEIVLDDSDKMIFRLKENNEEEV